MGEGDVVGRNSNSFLVIPRGVWIFWIQSSSMACSIPDVTCTIDANLLHVWVITSCVEPNVFGRVDTMSTSSKGYSNSLGLTISDSGKKSKLNLYYSQKARDKPIQVWSLLLSSFISHLRAWPSRLDENMWMRTLSSSPNWNISLQYLHKCV